MSPRPTPRKQRPELVKVRVSPEVARRLRRLATQREVSLSRLCYDALKAIVLPPPANAA